MSIIEGGNDVSNRASNRRDQADVNSTDEINTELLNTDELDNQVTTEGGNEEEVELQRLLGNANTLKIQEREDEDYQEGEHGNNQGEHVQNVRTVGDDNDGVQGGKGELNTSEVGISSMVIGIEAANFRKSPNSQREGDGREEVSCRKARAQVALSGEAELTFTERIRENVFDDIEVNWRHCFLC